jgi:hypothetical protein
MQGYVENCRGYAYVYPEAPYGIRIEIRRVMQGYARVCRDTHECAGIRTSVQGYARVCRDTYEGCSISSWPCLFLV